MPPAGEFLYASAHHAEKVWLFDFADPRAPTVARTLDPVPPFRYPHDIVRLPKGNLLIGFLRSEGPNPHPSDSLRPGGHRGLVEVTARGHPVRSATAAVPASRTLYDPTRLLCCRTSIGSSRPVRR